MRRACWILLALLATTGASPARRPLPVPPIPPANPPASRIAPVPDPDARPPVETADSGIQVRLHDFRLRPFQQGLGYAPGSQFESGEDKRSIQTPGFTVRVPLR